MEKVYQMSHRDFMRLSEKDKITICELYTNFVTGIYHTMFKIKWKCKKKTSV